MGVGGLKDGARGYIRTNKWNSSGDSIKEALEEACEMTL